MQCLFKKRCFFVLKRTRMFCEQLYLPLGRIVYDSDKINFMKKIYLLLIPFLSLIFSCENSQKLLNQGNYDEAIAVACKKLAKDKTDEKQVLVLEDAYKKDSEKDLARIQFLKQEGRPENWDEIYYTYAHLKNKQSIIVPLLPLFIKSQQRNANFNLVDLNADLIAAKQKAAEYDYASAMQLLDKGNKADARNAFEKLNRVKSLYPDYKDVSAQIDQAHFMGMTFILFKMQNQSGLPLPPDFESELTKISLSDLNRTWLEYNTQYVSGRNYDYTILVNMKMIDVSPEKADESTYTESRIVDDGFQYVLDDHGNVKKDAGGNDIKVAKTKTIFCSVTELHQFKRAMITGTLDFINNASQQLMKSEPLVAENVFTNNAARADGNIDALKPETRAKLGTQPVPFPPSPAMVLNAGQALKGRAKDIIYANKNLFY